MKRLLVFALTLLFAVALLARTCASLLDSQTDVGVTETILSGDRSGAKGLNAVFHSYVLYACAWDTAFSLGGEELEPTSSFTYSKNAGLIDRTYAEEDTFEMTPWRAGFGIPWNGGNLEIYSPYVMDAPANDVAARTQPGQWRCEVVRPSDYYTYWPWEASGRMDGDFFSSIALRREEGITLSGLFKVEVPRELLTEITVIKDGKGNVSGVFSSTTGAWHEPQTGETAEKQEWTYNAANDIPFTVQAAGAVSEEGLWVYPAAYDGGGNNVMEYRDGPGVYFIPKVSEKIWDTLSTPEQLSYDPGELLVNRAKLVYPTDETPVLLRVSADGAAVEVFTEDSGALWLTCLDSRTGEVLAGEQVMPGWSGQTDLNIKKGDLLLLMDSEGNAAVIRERGRETGTVFHTRVDLAILYGGSEGDRIPNAEKTDFAFDGEKLALANGYTRTILTADEEGTLYAARFDLSHIRSGSAGSGYRPHGTAREDPFGTPMEVRFE